MQVRYLRKWTRMPWWSSMHLIKQRNKLVHDDMYQMISPHLGNMQELNDPYNRMRPSNKEERENNYFIKQFLTKFPEFRFMDVGNLEKIDAGSVNLARLVMHFKKRVKDGLSEAAALEEVRRCLLSQQLEIEGKYNEFIANKRRNLAVANNLAVTNGARSLMDVYQQRAEYEARLKVERIKKDLDVQDFLGNQEIPAFTRNVSIVNKSYKSDGQKSDKESLDEAVKDYFERANELQKSYYERAYTADRLSNLSDDMLIYTIKETPSRIKRKTKNLLNQLEKYNVTLTQDGEPDFSECTNENFKNKYKKNQWVKYALMQKDLDFGFPHLEVQREAANEVKKSVFKRRAEFKDEIESLIKNEQSNKAELGDTIQTELDQAFGLTQRLQKFDNNEKSDIQMSASTIPYADIIQGGNYRLDDKELLLESFQERLARLEKKWFSERLSSLEGGVENLTPEEVKKRNQELVDKIRRVKLAIDREAIKYGEEMMFEEHSNLTEQQLMAESVPLERLINYYRLPKEQRQSNPVDDYQFRASMEFIRRKEIVEDLYDPSVLNQDAHLSLKDSNYKEPKSQVDQMKLKRQFDEAEFEEFRLESAKSDMQIRGAPANKKSKNSNSSKSSEKQYEKKSEKSETAMLLKFLQKQKNQTSN